MALRLPKFEDTRCCLLTACGQLLTEDKGIVKWLANQKPLDARYRASGRSGYVRVSFGGKSGKHLHIDVATREYFPRSPPKPTGRMSEIRQTFNRLAGQRINAGVEGLYLLPQADLPEMIRTTSVETRAGEVSLKTTGVTLGVHGAPIYELSWSVPDGESIACIMLAARRSTTIGDSYLEDCLQIVEAGFKAVFLGK